MRFYKARLLLGCGVVGEKTVSGLSIKKKVDYWHLTYQMKTLNMQNQALFFQTFFNNLILDALIYMCIV